MNNKQSTRRAGPTPVPPPVNLCACPGCRAHVARLEELNAQLSREVDRLSRDLREGKRAA